MSHARVSEVEATRGPPSTSTPWKSSGSLLGGYSRDQSWTFPLISQRGRDWPRQRRIPLDTQMTVRDQVLLTANPSVAVQPHLNLMHLEVFLFLKKNFNIYF